MCRVGTVRVVGVQELQRTAPRCGVSVCYSLPEHVCTLPKGHGGQHSFMWLCLNRDCYQAYFSERAARLCQSQGFCSKPPKFD